MNRLNSRMERIGSRISELEDRTIKITLSEKEKETLKNEQSLRDILVYNRISCYSHRRQEKKGRAEKIFEKIIA